MRGFLIALEAEAGSRDERLRDRLTQWRKSLGPGRAQEYSAGGFTCCLYTESETPIDHNAILVDDAAAITLFLGPRLVFLDRATLPSVDLDEADGNARDQRLVGEGMETTVFVSYRKASRSLLIKTDLLNSTLVYAARSGDTLLYSTSSFLLARLIDAETVTDSMLELVTEGVIYGGRSLYAGIRRLEPSRVFRFEPGKQAVSACYWEPKDTALNSIGLGESCDRIIDQLDREFRALEATGEKLVLDLTGGYDSRCNVGFALRNDLRFRTTVSGDISSADVEIAQRIADAYGIEHMRVAPLSGAFCAWARQIDAAFGCTDGEFDIVEYAHIHNVHRNHYLSDEWSVHGSTADLTRHYFFYPIDHHGPLAIDRMIAKKFTPLVDTMRFFRPGVARDWTAHMREQFAVEDDPALPAQARVNLLYLRLRMQHWQGRIASSTNRIHSSFTPWTSIPVLDAILTLRWKEMKSRLLTRTLVNRIHPGLDAIPMAGGSRAGLGPAAVFRAIPGTVHYVGSKVLERAGFGRSAAQRASRLWGLEQAVRDGADRLEDFLHPDLLDRMRRKEPLGLSDSVLGRVYTLMEARRRLERRFTQ